MWPCPDDAFTTTQTSWHATMAAATPSTPHTMQVMLPVRFRLSQRSHSIYCTPFLSRTALSLHSAAHSGPGRKTTLHHSTPIPSGVAITTIHSHPVRPQTRSNLTGPQPHHHPPTSIEHRQHRRPAPHPTATPAATPRLAQPSPLHRIPTCHTRMMLTVAGGALLAECVCFEAVCAASRSP